MSKPWRRLLLTHGLAMMVGLLLWLLTKEKPSLEATPEPRPIARSAFRSSDHGHLDSPLDERLKRIIEEEAADSEPDPLLLLPVREITSEFIKRQAQWIAKEREHLDRLLEMARGYRGVKDLNSPLLEALHHHNLDDAFAIFFEWHRRDPQEAFTQFAWRFGIFDPPLALFLHLPESDALQLLNREDQSEKDRSDLHGFYGITLGATDNLLALRNGLARTKNEELQRHFLINFLHRWVPDDGAEAARLLTQEFEEKERFLFLDEFEKRWNGHTYYGWTDELAEALLSSDLGTSESLRESLVETAESRFKERSELPLDAVVDDVHYHQAGIAGKYGASYVIGRILHHEKDYPELVIQGDLTIDDVAATVRAQIPDAAENELLFTESFFKSIGPYVPKQAMAWLLEQNHPDQDTIIQSSLLDVVGPDPRLPQMLSTLDLVPESALRTWLASASTAKKWTRWGEFAPEETQRFSESLAQPERLREVLFNKK